MNFNFLINLLFLKVTIGKKKGEMLGLMVVAAGIGAIIPTVIIAHLSKSGPAFKSGQLNVGDYLLSINGASLVGLSILQCIQHIKVLNYVLCNIVVRTSHNHFHYCILVYLYKLLTNAKASICSTVSLYHH